MPNSKNSYRDLRQELDNIVEQLQQGNTEDIDNAFKQYERGQLLVKELSQYLKETENKLNKISNK